MNRRKKKQINSLLSTVFGWIFSLIVLIPFAVILINSFKNEREAVSMSLSFPKEGWIWDNYRIVILSLIHIWQWRLRAGWGIVSRRAG